MVVTFLLPSSLRSKAHCCLHCSQVCGGPYFFSELVQRWHFVPIKAAMMLQYWQGLGCKDGSKTMLKGEFTNDGLRINAQLNEQAQAEFKLLWQKDWRNLLLTVPNCLTFWAHFLQIVLVLLERINKGFTAQNKCNKMTFPFAGTKAHMSHLSC